MQELSQQRFRNDCEVTRQKLINGLEKFAESMVGQFE